jgi:hypothetical protein
MRLLLIPIFAALLCLYPQSQACEGISPVDQQRVDQKIHQLASRFQTQKQPEFFVGLYSKVTLEDRQQLSVAVKNIEVEEGLQALETSQADLSERLRRDREQLIGWVQKNGLQSEIEIRTEPANGSFLILNSTKSGMIEMLCASSQGDIAAPIFDL